MSDYQLVHMPKRDPFPLGVFVIYLVIGGVKAALLNCLLATGRGLVIAIDNNQEIGRLRQRYSDNGLVTFVMGEGCSTYGLHRSTAANDLGAAIGTANVDLSDGFGGRLVNAHHGAIKLVESEDFQGFLKSLEDQIIVATHGCPEQIILNVEGSLSGSGCAGGHPVLTSAFTAHLSRLRIPVSVRFNFLGATAFAGKAKRARPNMASSLLSNLCLITDTADPSRDGVTYELSMHETQPFDNDQQLARCLIQDQVFVQSSQTEAHLGVLRPNWGSDGEYGHVKSREVDLMDGLDERRDIAPSLAVQYRTDLQEEAESIEADQGLIDEVEWHDDGQSKSRQEIDEIVSTSSQTTTDMFVDAVRRPARNERIRILVHTAHGSVFDLDRLRQDFSDTPASLAEFIARLQHIKTIEVKLREEQERRKAALVKLRNQLATSTWLLRSFHIASKRQTWGIRKGVQFLLTRRSHQVRDAHDRLLRTEAEAEAIERALSAVDREWAGHMETLACVQRELTRFIPAGSLIHVPQFVAMKPLEEAFPVLLKLSRCQDHDKVHLLCSLAGSVTADGVAKIVGASSDRLDEIAERVVFGKYAISGPPHGWRRARHYSLLMYALPPMQPDAEARLAELIQRRASGSKVVFTDTLAFGATVARIRVQRFSSVKALYSGLLEYSLHDAAKDDLAALNSIDGFKGINRFGGRNLGDAVHFS